jgi:hypothetical protein
VSQTEEQEIVTTQVALEVEKACQNSSIQAKIDIEKDEEAAVELGITWASLQASNSQRCNQYYLAEEDEGDEDEEDKEDKEDEGDEEEKDSDSEVANSSDSRLSDFDSSDDNDEEAGDHIIE